MKIYVCPECDLICREVSLAHQQTAYCPRCQAKLYKNDHISLDQVLSIAFTAMVLFILMNSFPLMSLKVQGNNSATTLFGAAWALWHDDMHLLSLLVGFTTIFVPAFQIALQLYLLCLLKFSRPQESLREPIEILQKLRSWSMVEVFMLGLLVSFVKLKDFADITIGVAFWSCALLILLSTLLTTMLTPRNFWLWSEVRQYKKRKTNLKQATSTKLKYKKLNLDDENLALQVGRHGAEAHLITCNICETLCKVETSEDQACPRCGAKLPILNKQNFIICTALLIAAYILYIPANLLPVMHTESILGAQDDTIISGVLLFLSSGEWPLALLIFFASILVPLLKLFSLTTLLWTSWRNSKKHALQRTKLFRVVEAIGRWSMLDVYVVAVSVALVQFGSIASIAPEGGIFAFGAVVVLTMLAAEHFDPRFIWQPLNQKSKTI